MARGYHDIAIDKSRMQDSGQTNYGFRTGPRFGISSLSLAFCRIPCGKACREPQGTYDMVEIILLDIISDTFDV